MAELLDDDESPKPIQAPGKYLPRIVYKPPEEEAKPEEAEDLKEGAAKVKATLPKPDRAPPKKKKKPKTDDKPKKAKDPEKQGVLIEETPESETYEARKRARMIIGAAAAAAILIVILVIYRTLAPPAEENDEIPTGPPVVTAPDLSKQHALMESQANQLLNDAKRYEKAGRRDLALDRLDKIAQDYPQSTVMGLAQQARERHAKDLPLFGDVIVADKAKSKPPKPKDPPPDTDPVVVEVAKAKDTAVAVPPTEAHPGIVPPEPRRETGVGLSKADVAARVLPQGFHAREEAGVHASGWPLEITCDRDGATMVLIPGGVFVQGRDDGRLEERPAHKVQLPPYYIDQHEVTVRQFERYSPSKEAPNPKSLDYPVVKVNLNDALAYAKWAGKMIPAEAQWEMAARATDARIHPWGNDRAAFDHPREPKQIDPVMSFPSDLSPYAVFDLAGNAWEWTNDWFDTKYYQQFKKSTAVSPTGPPHGLGRNPEVVVKGGSKDWDASWRSGMQPEARLPYIGFRCVLNVDPNSGTITPPPSTTNPPAAPNLPRNAPGGSVPF